MQRYQTPPSSDPLPGLTETGQTPTTHPAILPAPRAPPDSSGIRDRDPTRSTAGRRISTILRLALLLSGHWHPSVPCLAQLSSKLTVLILCFSQGQGSCGL